MELGKNEMRILRRRIQAIHAVATALLQQGLFAGMASFREARSPRILSRTGNETEDQSESERAGSMMRLSNDYWNEAKSQRGTTVERDHRDTFHSRAQAALDDESGGRFAKVTSSKVTGATPVQYPAIPSGPWSEGDPGAPDPVTDQFGDVNEMEPIGSHVEIERSLQRRDATSANGASPSVDASAPESAEAVSSPPPADSTPPRKSSFRRF
jgi:hypothetical protein